MFKILIVDDENLIRYCLSATFRDPAFAVRTAASGQEALAAIREHSFDVCILDLHLPDMNGIDIMQLLRKIAPDTKVIVISGETLTRDSRKIVEENAVLYMDKPFDLEQVRGFVNMLMERRRRTGPAAGAWTATERRRDVRRTADTTVRYSVIDQNGDTRAIDQEATLRDVSDKGVRLYTRFPVEPGWWVQLSDGHQVNQGIVRWRSELDRDGTFFVGVQIEQSEA